MGELQVIFGIGLPYAAQARESLEPVARNGGVGLSKMTGGSVRESTLQIKTWQPDFVIEAE